MLYLLVGEIKIKRKKTPIYFYMGVLVESSSDEYAFMKATRIGAERTITKAYCSLTNTIITIHDIFA